MPHNIGQKLVKKAYFNNFKNIFDSSYKIQCLLGQIKRAQMSGRQTIGKCTVVSCTVLYHYPSLTPYLP
jgi:hypothetical protein